VVSTLSRRRLLVLAGASCVAALTACTPGARDVRRPDAPCVPRAELELRRLLGDLPLVYEPSEQRQTFWFDHGFAARLDAWVTELDPVVGSAPTQLRTYGSWLDGRQTCDSWHHAGRAFDLAQVRIEGGPAVSCRYDRWRTETGTALLESRRAYWRVAASLHRRFAYVLTYLYDDQHANHIHVDNGRSEGELSIFAPRSRVQVQAVQAICSYLWDEPVELTGRWDRATRSATRRVLDRIGAADDLDASAESWHAFLRASSSVA
jgi:hypothetical protein